MKPSFPGDSSHDPFYIFLYFCIHDRWRSLGLPPVIFREQTVSVDGEKSLTSQRSPRCTTSSGARGLENVSEFRGEFLDLGSKAYLANG